MALQKILDRILNRHRGDKERIVRAFPKAIHDDVRSVLKILPFENHTLRLADGRFHFVDNFVSDFRPLILSLREEEVELPYRIYLEEPKDAILSDMSESQQRIVSCIYLRHHNGFIRQKYLERLFGATEDFICPFAVQLIGEYVIEILYDLEKLITPKVLPQYASFIAANPFYWKQTESRMISYWNEYYRSAFPKLKDYVGKRLVDRLSSAAHELT